MPRRPFPDAREVQLEAKPKLPFSTRASMAPASGSASRLLAVRNAACPASMPVRSRRAMARSTRAGSTFSPRLRSASPISRSGVMPGRSDTVCGTERSIRRAVGTPSTFSPICSRTVAPSSRFTPSATLAFRVLPSDRRNWICPASTETTRPCTTSPEVMRSALPPTGIPASGCEPSIRIDDSPLPPKCRV